MEASVRNLTWKCANEVWSGMGENEYPEIMWSHQEDGEWFVKNVYLSEMESSSRRGRLL